MESCEWGGRQRLLKKSTGRNARSLMSSPECKAARMPIGAIVGNVDYGVSVAEIAEQFEVSPNCVEPILMYAKSHRNARRV
jgi:hypothetical protein